MSIYDPAPSPAPARALGLLRIVVGLVFMTAGTQKLFGFPPSDPPMAVQLFSQMGLAGVLETFGGALLALGLLTRPVAFVLCGEMAIAYLTAHAPKSVFPTLNGGQPALLYCFAFLAFAFTGAGAFSLDAVLARRRTEAPRARRVEVDVVDDGGGLILNPL
jgi:putative oxidoreductase